MKHAQLLRETRTIFTNGLLFKNPALVGALGLFPIVAGCFSVRNAAELSLLFFFIALPSGLALCFLGPLLTQWVRSGVVLMCAALFYLPAMWLTDQIFPGASSALGVLAGLMVCNSILLSRVNDYAPTHIVWAVLADVLGCSLGYAAVMLITATVRELMLTGSLWNRFPELLAAAKTGAAALPFFGFLVLGFLAAFVQWMNGRRSARATKRRVTRS